MNKKFFVFIFFSVLILFWGFLFYKFYFEKKFETRNEINKIIELKIDSCQISKFSNTINYEFFISNKYRVSIDSVKFVPFKSVSSVEICVKNILGEIVVSNWVSSYYWQNDMDKLMKHFKVFVVQNNK